MTSHFSRRNALRLGLGLGAAATLGTAAAAPAQAYVYGPRVANGTFTSRRMGGRSVAYEVLYPPGYGPGDRLPVLITLHGHGANRGTPEGLRYLEHSESLVHEGRPLFACAGVDGGDLWWHDRSSGLNPAGMVIEDFGQVLANLNLDVSRPAYYGYSMGGVGAIWIASLLGPSRVSSLLVTSTPFPARWDQFGGSYDSPQSFVAHDVRSAWHGLRGIPVRVDIGDRDPFLAQNRAMIPQADPAPEFHIGSGGHDWTYWESIALDQFRWVSDRIRR